MEAGYGSVTALHGVSLDIGEGEIVTLLGANGAGKTTTLLTISGLLACRMGTVKFRGRPLGKMPAHQVVREGVSHVPEGRRIFSRLTVEENLRLGAYTRKPSDEIQQDMDHLYQLFPILAERRRQLGGTLSGGEQQMLAIGRGLMSRPTLLLLDEPSLGLAPKIEQLIFQVIQAINKEGTTILLVEQNAHLALQVAHRGYVMETGRICLEDTAQNLLHNDNVRKVYLGE